MPGRVVGRSALGQLDQARQETGQGLASARGRDEQGVPAGPRLLQHLQLMPPRPPPPLLEPAGEARGQGAGKGLGRGRQAIHGQSSLQPEPSK